MNVIEEIENELNVTLAVSADGEIECRGPASAVDRALVRVAAARDDVAAALRQRQGLAEEPIVVRRIAASIPSLAVQRQNYVAWFRAHPRYFWPSDAELDAMFAALSEGDEVIPDFAMSFSVRKADGRVIAVDRKGRISQPSPYSPALRGGK